MSLPVLHIGPYAIDTPLILAPMAGVTDRPFRQLCRRWGAGMAVSEMVSSNSLLWGSEKTRRRANHQGEPTPRSVQIAGADPAMMAGSARYNADQGADIIDINMGCPAKKICRVMAGSALLQDEPLVGRILQAVVEAVAVPVTLKIRTGWSPEQRNGVRIAQIAEASGIQALAVHGRTRACAYRGDAEYDTIADIKQAVQIPVLANGDITSPEKARQVLEYTGADGLMVGRAAQGKPWIFQQIAHYLKTGCHLPEPPLQVQRRVLLEHLDALYGFYGEHTGVRVARKHISWYSRGQRDSAGFRAQMNRTQTCADQLTMTRAFFDQRLDELAAAA